jgi:carbon storage regulator CsrA
MIVLDCKRNEQIMIGESITVRVLTLGGHRVRLGIDAPIQTPIARAELPRMDHRSDAPRAPHAFTKGTDKSANHNQRSADRPETRHLDDHSDSDESPAFVQDMVMDLP